MPEWNWTVELGTAILRSQLRNAFALRDVVEQRRYLDCLLLDAGPSASKVTAQEVVGEEVRGTWLTLDPPSPITLLYLHGGGFAFYPKDSYRNFIALITEAANTSTFVLDYRLTPEHPYPAALEDVRAAYRWLLIQGVSPERLVVAGDSAGGNLTLALLCDLRDRGLPLPAFAFALSPATDFDSVRPSMTVNEPFDWLSAVMALTWRDWYCRPEQRSLPLVSPIRADLRGLPPIYIQAGRAEILYDSIAAFAVEAKSQGARVTLETWPGMNHVFQFFGEQAASSAAALRRIGEMVALSLHASVSN
jgi:acetyl esterase/lipase